MPLILVFKIVVCNLVAVISISKICIVTKIQKDLSCINTGSFVFLHRKKIIIKTLAKDKINLKSCTKEQIIDVIKAAKERKLAWEERVHSEMKMRQELRKKAQEYHYYDIVSR